MVILGPSSSRSSCFTLYGPFGQMVKRARRLEKMDNVLLSKQNGLFCIRQSSVDITSCFTFDPFAFGTKNLHDRRVAHIVLERERFGCF